MQRRQCCVAACFVAPHNSYVMIVPFQEGGSTGVARRHIRKEPEMFDIVSRARNAIAKRNRYNRMVSEINGLSERDLADFNGNRTDMLQAAYKDVYGS
jgi:uncharacterized protein YjiS (DUF1127 family)